MQGIVVAGIVVAAIAYLGIRIRAAVRTARRGESRCGPDCGCH